MTGDISFITRLTPKPTMTKNGIFLNPTSQPIKRIPLGCCRRRDIKQEAVLVAARANGHGMARVDIEVDRPHILYFVPARPESSLIVDSKIAKTFKEANIETMIVTAPTSVDIIYAKIVAETGLRGGLLRKHARKIGLVTIGCSLGGGVGLFAYLETHSNTVFGITATLAAVIINFVLLRPQTEAKEKNSRFPTLKGQMLIHIPFALFTSAWFYFVGGAWLALAVFIAQFGGILVTRHLMKKLFDR